MFGKLKIWLLLLLAAAGVVGCECVPNVDTSRQLYPNSYAYAAPVYALADSAELQIESDGFYVESELDFSTIDYKYLKVGSGTTNLRLYKIEKNGSKTTVFNSMFEFAENDLYSLICYGSTQRIRVLAFNDSLKTKNPNKTYVRFVNVAISSPNIVFKIRNTDIETTPAGYRYSSPIMELEPRNYDIQALNENDSLLYELKNIGLQAGFMNNIIIKGDFSEKSKYKPSLVFAMAKFQNL